MSQENVEIVRSTLDAMLRGDDEDATCGFQEDAVGTTPFRPQSASPPIGRSRWARLRALLNPHRWPPPLACEPLGRRAPGAWPRADRGLRGSKTVPFSPYRSKCGLWLHRAKGSTMSAGGCLGEVQTSGVRARERRSCCAQQAKAVDPCWTLLLVVRSGRLGSGPAHARFRTRGHASTAREDRPARFYRSSQVRRRRTHQKQNPTRMTARPTKIAVSYPWSGQ
jgi:hypothetical protein